MKKAIVFFNREQNLLIHLIATLLVTILGICFKLSVIEWVLIFFVVSLVISSELLNSAIELTVDMFTQEFNSLAMVAKDTAAGAVVISAFTALGVGLYVFLPKVILLIRNFF